MRKFWVVLLSIGLLVAFTMPVCAADVKFSGSYEAQGYYENNRALSDPEDGDFHNVWQRLRVQTVFQIQEGLSLTTRFDAMEKIWGAGPQARSAGNAIDSGQPSQENDNIKFEQVYISANILGGLFRAGYQQQGVFGTWFCDADSAYGPRVRYDYAVGPFNFLVLWDKVEGAKAYNAGAATADVDKDQNKWDAAFQYKFKGGDAGLLFIFLNDTASSDVADGGFKRKWYVFDPYVRAKLGPVYIEAEAFYMTGYTKDFEDDATKPNKDIKKDGWSLYAMAKGDFGPAYAGIMGAWIFGDDDAKDDKDHSGYPGSGAFNPCLMLWNYDLSRWNGTMGKYATITGGQAGMTNAKFGQIFAGIKPIPKLDVKFSWSYARIDEKPKNVDIDAEIGHEFDLTATYKIYDNLSYMIGAAYFVTGDYFKGKEPNDNNKIENDYLLTHKLTLTF
ncbi:MAG: hypothetical protein ABFD82_08625 [Syntrophaceae bacterium]